MMEIFIFDNCRDIFIGKLGNFVMKQIKAFVQRNKLDSVIDAVEKQGVGGLTVIQAQGRGKGERPMIGDPRGTGTHKAQFNTLESLVVVVDDSKVNSVANAIVEVASTGSKGDGKIFIIPVEESIDIGTKQKGADTL
jgi:nitrogen regulatory protein P-II 1